MFRMVDLILKKRDGEKLTKEEINFIIEGYVNNTIPDYQVSALLMAIYYNPLSEDEIQKLNFNVNYKLWLDAFFAKLIIGG